MFLYEGIRDEEPEESPAFENLVFDLFCIFIFFAALHFFFEFLEMVSECWKKRKYKERYKEVDCVDRSSQTVKQSSPQRYTYIENKIRMDDFTIKTDVTIDVPRRVRCGTPFIQARREQERKERERIEREQKERKH